MSRVHDIPVGEIMSRDVRCVSPNTTIHEALDMLTETQRTGMPVLGERGTIIGSICMRDIALAERDLHENYEVDQRLRKALLGWGGEALLTEEEALHVEKPIDGMVSDCMSPEAFSVDPSQTVGEAARFMVGKNAHRLFVTDAGTVRGVVTVMDLLRLLATDQE